VISGFIMYVTTRHSAMGSGDFMMRRIIRIVPLYWLLTGLMCLIWLVKPDLFKTLIVTPLTLIQSLFFVPHYSLSFPESVFPLLVPGWTLNFEMFFYGIMALALLLPKKFLLPTVTLALAGLVSAGVLFGPFEEAIPVTYTSAVLLEFATGMWIGAIWHRHQNGFTAAEGVTVFMLGWLLLIGNSVYAVSKYLEIAGATLIVAGSLNALFLHWHNALLKLLGDATYAIYLSHIFTLGVVRMVWAQVFGTDASTLNAMAFALVSMGVCLFVGVMVYWVLEQPVTRQLNRLWARRSGKAHLA
jgi:exopolysaccharide production protein ExoZ